MSASETNQRKSGRRGRGGRRAGAGRKPGSASKKTREIANKAAELGVTPLEVMLKSMRDAWENGDKSTACLLAKDCAPYLHPRLTSIDNNVTVKTSFIDALKRIEEADREPHVQSDHTPRVTH